MKSEVLSHAAIIEIPQEIKVISKKGVCSAYFNIKFPDGSNGMLTLSKVNISREDWRPINHIKKIYIQWQY